jgi:hypothetical protein
LEQRPQVGHVEPHSPAAAIWGWTKKRHVSH